MSAPPVDYSMRVIVGLLLLGVIAAVAWGLSGLAAEPVRDQRDMAKAVTEAFGSVDRTSGWCDDTTSTPSNVWTSANVPAELKTGAIGLLNRYYVRNVRVRLVDAIDTAIPVCVRLGPNTDVATGRVALTCDATAGAENTNGDFIRGVAEGRSYQIERISIEDQGQLWLRASSGTVRYCVSVSWHNGG